ncbi:3717_t:CDS:1, partial [Acaulospora morrowiae]
TRTDNSEKGADAYFRSKKPRVAPPNGSDKKAPFTGSEIFRTMILYFHDSRMNLVESRH